MRAVMLVLASVSLATMALAQAQAPVAPVPAGPQPGDVAPAFSLSGSDGAVHALADFKGKQAVVLAWFPKAFTGGWTAECKSLRESGVAIRAFDVAYFAASVDTPDDNRKFAEELGLDFPLLSDPGKQVATAYGVVNAERPLARRWTFYIGKDGKVLYVETKVSTATAGQDVAAKLAELGIARK